MKIFLACGNDAQRDAQALAAALEGRGVQVVFGGNAVSLGSRWPSALEEQIASADGYVFLTRAGEEPSELLRLEWRKAAKHAALRPGAKIIPVVIGGVSPPQFLRLWSAIPMHGDPRETSARILNVMRQPGDNETSPDSPQMQPLVASWRRRLEEVERYARSMTPEAQELERVE